MFYLDLFHALARHDVRYVVVGGLALNLHGVERATMDVDLVIALDPPNLGAAIDAFERLDLAPVAPVKIEEARDPENLARWRRERNMIAFGMRPKSGTGPTVDCLIDSAIPFARLAGNAVTKAIGAVRVPVASIDDLIAMKRASGRAIASRHRRTRAPEAAGAGSLMRTVDCHYTISDERLRAYAAVPLLDRLRWLDELVQFTQMWRAAPREAGLGDGAPVDPTAAG